MRALCILVSFALAALAVASPSRAQVAQPAPQTQQARAETPPRTRHRWFLTFGIMPLRYSRFSMGEADEPSREASRLELALGGPASLAIGYGILEVFVVELQASVQRVQNDDDDNDNTADPPVSLFDATRSTTSISVGPMARLFLTRSLFQPFVEAGFGFGYVHTELGMGSFSLRSLSARAGAGGQWRFADAASVSAALDVGFESTSGRTSVDDVTLVPVGERPRTSDQDEVELGGDTFVVGLDLRLTVWL